MAVEFTPHQRDAIAYRQLDACVIAGPGSGKTTVLVERYRELIEHHNFQVAEILAISFTEKAAANIRAKVAEKFRHSPLHLRELESAWISTIHGFCARLLREHSIAAGIDPRFTVLDARESEDLQAESVAAALDEMIAARRATGLELIELVQAPRTLAYDLRNAWDAIRSAGKSSEDVRAMPGPLPASHPDQLAARLVHLVRNWPAKLSDVQIEQRAHLLAWAAQIAANPALLAKPPINLRRVPPDEKPALTALREEMQAAAIDLQTAPYRALLFDVLARFEALYTDRKRATGSLDFSDLERLSIALLRAHPAIRARTRQRFRQIMLDEFQDINEQQSELIDLIRDDDVFFAVGDRNQSIYGFRHARPGIFDDYRRHVEAQGKHSTRLFDNFRSRAEILSCVEQLLHGTEGIETRALVAGLTFPPKTGPSVEILRICDDEEHDEASRREARWIAHRILSLHAAGTQFRQFAVLCRAGDSMAPILEEFDRLRVPYVCGRRQSFLLSREVRDIVALLHTVANPRDSISLATVLRSPLVGLGDETLLRLRLTAGSLASALGMPLDEAARLDERFARFLENLHHWRADRQIVPLDLLIARMLTDCGFHFVPGTLVAENVEAFLRLARARGAQRNLLLFLRELESMENAVSAESDLSDEEQGNCVQVMTAHAAKGLEFAVTIVAAIHKGTRRGNPAVSFTPEHGLGLRWFDPSNKHGRKDSWSAANGERVKQREEEESNRLLYVAMTRAGEHLILSYSVGSKAPDNWAKLVETVFGLKDRPLSGEAEVVAADGFDISVLSTNADPPPLPPLDTLQARGGEVLTIPRPRIHDRHDAEVSATSLVLFADCPRKYYLQRYIGWSSMNAAGDAAAVNDDDDVPAADLGSMVHEILAGRTGVYPDDAHALANVFLASPQGQRAAAASKSAREWTFIAEVENAVVRGSIDLWFEDATGIHVVDYKTDDLPRAAVPARAVLYTPQLALYALAIERAFGQPPATVALHFLRPDVVHEIPVDAALLDSAKHLIHSLRDAQNELSFPLHEAPRCRYCPFYRNLCPAT